MFSLNAPKAADLGRAALLKLLIRCPGAYDYETYSKSLDIFAKHTLLNLDDMLEVLKASDLHLSTTQGELVVHKLPLSQLFLVLDGEDSWVSSIIELEGYLCLPQDYTDTSPSIKDTISTFYFPE